MKTLKFKIREISRLAKSKFLRNAIFSYDLLIFCFELFLIDYIQIETTDNKSSLTIREVYLEDSGVFSVKAENAVGSAKSSANLVVEGMLI